MSPQINLNIVIFQIANAGLVEKMMRFHSPFGYNSTHTNYSCTLNGNLLGSIHCENSLLIHLLILISHPYFLVCAFNIGQQKVVLERE